MESHNPPVAMLSMRRRDVYAAAGTALLSYASRSIFTNSQAPASLDAALIPVVLAVPYLRSQLSPSAAIDVGFENIVVGSAAGLLSFGLYGDPGTTAIGVQMCAAASVTFARILSLVSGATSNAVTAAEPLV